MFFEDQFKAMKGRVQRIFALKQIVKKPNIKEEDRKES